MMSQETFSYDELTDDNKNRDGLNLNLELNLEEADDFIRY